MKWAIREAVDVYFKALSTFKLGARTIRKGEPVLILDTVKVGTSEITAEESFVTGGRGNSRLLSFEGDKAMTFSFEDALLSNEGLAILSGAELIPARDKSLNNGIGESVISHKTESVTVSASKTVVFDKVPFVGEGADIYGILLDNNGEFSGVPIQIQYKNQTASTGANLTLTTAPTSGAIVGIDSMGKAVELSGSESPYTVPSNYFDQVIAFRAAATGDDDKIKLTSTSSGYDASKVTVKPFLTNGKATATIPSFKEGDTVLLDYYVEYKHDATQISILPDKFAPYMYVEGASLIRRQSDGLDIPVEFEIPKFKIKTAITLTMQSTGDASTFTFSGDAYKAYSKFDKTRQILANIKILDADDNYDLTGGEDAGDPTKYDRYQYDDNTDGNYIWKDATKEPHENIDKTDTKMDGYTTDAPTL